MGAIWGLAYRHGVCKLHFVATLGGRGGFLELAYQLIQVTQLPHQLVDAVDGMLTTDAGVISQGLDAEHVAVDLGSDVGLLLYRLGNLAAAGGNRV